MLNTNYSTEETYCSAINLSSLTYVNDCFTSNF